jgi:hypothetical protein
MKRRSFARSALLTSRVFALWMLLVMVAAVLPAFPAEQAAAQDFHSHTLTKLDCNPGYDPATGNPQAAFDNCQIPGTGINFTLSTQNPNYPGSTQATNGSGQAFWGDIPAGTAFTVIESLPTGYGTPWVYCEVSGNPNNAGDVQSSFFQAAGGAMDVGLTDPSLTAYAQSACYWFNVPPANGQLLPEEEAGTSLHITKYDCPSGYAGSNPTLTDYQLDCLDRHPGVLFGVIESDGDQRDPEPTDSNGEVHFDGLPFGDVDVYEILPEGYAPPVVYCQVHPQDDAQASISDEHLVPPGSAQGQQYVLLLNAPEGNKIDCLWFNIPPPVESAMVYITKHICPPLMDPGSATRSDYVAECVDPHEGVTYQIPPSGELAGRESDTGANGQVQFDDVPFGTLTLHEIKPPGYSLGAVFCRPIQPQEVGEAQPSDEPVPFTEEQGHYAIEYDIPEGLYLLCDFYNLPAEEEGATVFITKYLCPPDIDYSSASAGLLVVGCPNPHEGVHFEIPANAGGHEGTTDADGALELPGIPYGNIELHEDQLPGYSTARAYCFSVPNGESDRPISDEDLVEVIAPTETSGDYIIQYEIPEGHDLYCVIFNAPAEEDGEPGLVEVTKYICPVEYDHQTQNLDGLIDNCTTPHEGAGINLWRSGESLLGGETDAAGVEEWEDTPSGPVTLRELTEGYALVRVYCHGVPAGETNTLIDEYDEALIYRDGEFYHADIHLEPGYHLHCYLFNAPVEDEHGTVHVYKYACPGGVAFEGADREYFEANCTEPVEGISFGVGSESETYQEERTTDSAGLATWENVPAGGIGILEAPAAGYQLLSVYCGVIGQNNLSQPETWEEAPYQDGLEYDLPAGQFLHCYFYNAPDQDHGSIVITKYLCGPLTLAVDGGGPTHEIFLQQCTDIGVGYEFTLTYQSTDTPEETDSSGQASWSGLDPGDYTVSESLPTDYGSWAVYCSTDPSGTYEEYAGQEETSFDYTVEAGVTLYCDWFNAAPPTDTYVEVVKYLCPEGYDYAAADYAGMSGNCTETIAEVPFNVFNESGYTSPKTTNDEGVATWNTVPPGLVSIQETPGEGYLPVKVYCSNTPDDETTPPLFQGYDLDAETYHIEFGVTAAYRLVCHWFNAPVEVGTVVVYKYTCGLFFTRGDAGYEDFAENCTTPGEGFTFSLYDSADELADEQATGPDGTATLTAPGGGTYTILEEELPDYLTLAVYCTDDLTVPPTTAEETPPSIDLTLGITLYCYWFNIEYEAPPYDPGSIVIHKYNCPPGFPTEPQGGRSPQGHFFDGCQVPASGVNFNAEQGGNTVGSGATDTAGTAIITGVAAGTTRISELPREGYGPPKIFCASYPTTGPTILFSYDEQTVDNWGHTYDLVEDEVLECYWFNFPNSQGEEGQPIQIIIYKYLCEAGYEYSGQDYETISADCTAAENQVNFDVTGGDGQTSGGPTDVNGYAEYNGVASGSLLITETPREGFQNLAVYCTNYVSTPGTPSLFPTEEGQLNYYLADGYTLECYWFNIETPDEGHVVLIKFVCDVSYEHEGASRDDLYANCTDKLPEVGFNLSGPNNYDQSETTGQDGETGWLQVPAGTYSLAESPPSGYFPVRAFCAEVMDNGPTPYDQEFAGQWVEYPVNPLLNPSIELEVRAGYWLYCEWYNETLPEYGTVYVYKYYCPEDYDYSTASRDDLYAACSTQPHEGVEYHLAAGDYAESRTTDSAGLAQWELVPSGSASITEDPPEGYQPVRVYCGEAQQNSGTLPATWQDYPFDSSWTITYTVPADYYVTCEWYNFPYEEDPPQVWIQKYNCPEEADWHWSYHQFLSNCHEPGANVEFGIGPDTSSLSLSITDAQGRIILGDLDPGTLAIQETLPSGYGGVVVFCQFVYPGYTGPYQKADVFDQTIQLDLEDGYIVTCIWFDLLAGLEPPAATPPASGHPPLQPTGGGGTGGGGTAGGTSGGGTSGGTSGAGGTASGGQDLPEVDQDTPANLIITKYTCEPLYDVHLEVSDPAVDCETLTDDVPFTLSNEDETDPVELQGVTGDDGEGQVSFSDLAAGPYVLTEEMPEGTISAFIYTCESDRRDFEQENPFTPFAYAGPDGRIGVTLVPGETLECDWYNVPEEQAGGQVTITKYSCSGSSVIVAQCQIFPDGVTISLVPAGDSGEPIELTTGEDGTATAAVEGTYTVQELPDTACLIDSDAFDQEGNLVVNEGDEVEVLVYNCAGT